jgi:hypothetical protein
LAKAELAPWRAAFNILQKDEERIEQGRKNKKGCGKRSIYMPSSI